MIWVEQFLIFMCRFFRIWILHGFLEEPYVITQILHRYEPDLEYKVLAEAPLSQSAQAKPKFGIREICLLMPLLWPEYVFLPKAYCETQQGLDLELGVAEGKPSWWDLFPLKKRQKTVLAFSLCSSMDRHKKVAIYKLRARLSHHTADPGVPWPSAKWETFCHLSNLACVSSL